MSNNQHYEREACKLTSTVERAAEEALQAILSITNARLRKKLHDNLLKVLQEAFNDTLHS